MNKVKKVAVFIFTIALLMSVSFLSFQGIHYFQVLEARETLAVQTPAAEQPHVWKGEYTIFQYTQHGWANRLYVTEYYIKDGIIYYKSREHQSEYLPVQFDNTLTVPKWIEAPDELVEYGFWQPVLD